MKIISPTGLGIRNDPMGLGIYGAPRGHRIHQGLDFVCKPGQDVLCPIVSGKLMREAKPYADDEKYSGCLIWGRQIIIKMFYLKPWKWVIGEYIKQGDPIGIAQDISEKYGEDMTPHIHLTIVSLDPEILME